MRRDRTRSGKGTSAAAVAGVTGDLAAVAVVFDVQANGACERIGGVQVM